MNASSTMQVDLARAPIESLLVEFGSLAVRLRDANEAEQHDLAGCIDDEWGRIAAEIERRSDIAQDRMAVTRRIAPAVAARIDAGDFGGAADEFLVWLEARMEARR